ncbi:uncharacterized protein L201_006395 [Kwoniella dendrophila CBS 6074]|uniref:Uncharacterized protein n=1 Tax=Kwoniella dendrophila CBS 6074 TaxID=1295534 RepID=A0AAX4K2W3_9TREE
MQNPLLRIILCGQSTGVGKAVIDGLKPEIEVSRFFTSIEEAKRDIPLILSGQISKIGKLDEDVEKLGTQKFDTIPQGIMLGGAYSVSDQQTINDSFKGISNLKQVPFFFSDDKIEMPPLGPKYGAAILKRAREALIDYSKLSEDEQKDKAGKVIWY